MATQRHTYEPVPAREAFEEASPDARQTQAALLLSIGAAVGGEPDHVPKHEQFSMPALAPMAHPAPIPLERAARALDISTREYVDGFSGRIPRDEASRLTQRLYENPEPDTAAALVEAGLHSDSRLVRTAAATAALDTTGAREDVMAQLVSSAKVSDIDTRELARTGLARAQPDHPLLDRYVINRPAVATRATPSNTAVLSHGTWAAKSRWWRPGGDFHDHLSGITPSLHMHDKSFPWSGAYSHLQRDLAAIDLAAWIDAQQLDRPDWFAHSHGATVANLATKKGVELGRLVFLSCPVHDAWLPDLDRVDRVIDVRVRADLVIIADRGQQRLPSAMRSHPKVTEVRNGWFSHSSTHDPQYWDDHDIASRL